MKKYICLFLLIFLSCTNVYAYTVEDVYINASIDILGSIHVTEAIILEGDINGFELILNYQNSDLNTCEAGNIDFYGCSIYNGHAISLSNVYSFNIEEEEIGWSVLDNTSSPSEEVESASNGDVGIYTYEETDDGIKLRIYNRTLSGYTVFLVDYYVDQVVVLHEDVAELYWQFIPEDFDYIENAYIQVTAPGNSSGDVFRVWAHGPLSGTVYRISDDDDETLYKGLLAEAYDIDETGIEVRMTFDKDLLYDYAGIDKSEVQALDSIIEVETERADDANSKRTYNKVMFYGTYIAGGLYILGLIILTIRAYFKYDKEYKIDFPHQYYREFTGDYNVEVVDYLMNKNVSTKAMSASVMNLIYKKNIEIEEIPDSKKNLILKEVSRDNINEAETTLMELLFDTVGKDKQVTLKEIEKFSSKYSTASLFMNKYNEWKYQVQQDGINEKFYEDYTSQRTLCVLYVFVGILIIVLGVIAEIEAPIVYISIIIFSIVYLIYMFSFKKYTKKGREHYLKWNAFRNFLKDFGSFKDKEIPEVALWEKYLVYACVFGLAKEVQKEMKVRLNQNQDVDVDFPMLYTHIYFADTLSRTIESAQSKSLSTINAHNVDTIASVGSGIGGGMSSGGGFGGGGGSGHGF